MKLKAHIFDTGYTVALKGLLVRGGGWRRVRCHSLAALLLHPQEGPVLFDTGYAPRILAATYPWPYRLYRWVTPLHVRAGMSVAAQLPRFGLRPADIRHVVISHFHADHVAGLLDFPEARIVATRSGYEDVRGRRGWRALKRAFLPQLMPTDLERRAHLLLSPLQGEPLPGLGPSHDLFGDGSLRLVELPGHARGQIGMLATTDRGDILLAADGCWLSRQVRERRPPHRLTYLIADNARQVRATIEGLHRFAQARPDVRIVPCHCPEAYSYATGLEMEAQGA